MKLALILILSGILYSLNVESQDSLIERDSIINVDFNKQSNYTGKCLNDSLAKEILYDYFNKKGILIADNLSKKTTKKDYNKLCVRYDTLYLVDLNNNKNTDAIIEYWLAPLASSGHCYQPHKAMIVDQDSGYRIINADFISSDFIIDSVSSDNSRIVICGSNFDCSSNQILNRYNLILKK